MRGERYQGLSTPPPAIGLREAALRMTVLLKGVDRAVSWFEWVGARRVDLVSGGQGLWLTGALTAAQEESHGAALDEDGEDYQDIG